jgi:hypothetical protein
MENPDPKGSYRIAANNSADGEITSVFSAEKESLTGDLALL